MARDFYTCQKKEGPQMHMTSKNLKLVTSFTFAIVVACILLYVLIIVRDTLSWLSSAFGLATGWATGFLLAPYESEQQRFKEYVKFISVFISGYLVSKIDRLFDLWFDPEHGPLLLHSIVAHRILICATSFVMAAVTTYVARKYVSFGPGSEQPPKSH
jgi:energy-coupling factor transporter transmembrane protein EcfT